MNADAVAALLHDVLGAECSGTHSLGYATCQRQAAALAAAPLPSPEPREAVVAARDAVRILDEVIGYLGHSIYGPHNHVPELRKVRRALMVAPLPSDTPADGLDVERLRDDEWLGDTLHHLAHPGHEWSGCAYPDLWYDKAAEFLAALALTQEPRSTREEAE